MSLKAWKTLAIIEFCICIFLLIEQIKGPAVNFTNKLKRYKPGRCLSNEADLKGDSNYVKVAFSLKGSNVGFADFIWGDSNYASNPGCIHPINNRTEHVFANFIYQIREKVFPTFYATIYSSANDNSCAFTMTISDLKGNVIGKYPEDKPQEITIHFIGSPYILSGTVKKSQK